MTEKPAIDEAMFAELESIMKDKTGLIIQKFLESSKELMEGIAKGGATASPELLKENAHALKSISMQIGATLLANLVTEIDHFAEKRQVEPTLPLIERAQAAYIEVRSALEERLKNYS